MAGGEDPGGDAPDQSQGTAGDTLQHRGVRSADRRPPAGVGLRQGHAEEDADLLADAQAVGSARLRVPEGAGDVPDRWPAGG